MLAGQRWLQLDEVEVQCHHQQQEQQQQHDLRMTARQLLAVQCVTARCWWQCWKLQFEAELDLALAPLLLV